MNRNQQGGAGQEGKNGQGSMADRLQKLRGQNRDYYSDHQAKLGGLERLADAKPQSRAKADGDVLAWFEVRLRQMGERQYETARAIVQNREEE